MATRGARSIDLQDFDVNRIRNRNTGRFHFVTIDGDTGRYSALCPHVTAAFSGHSIPDDPHTLYRIARDSCHDCLALLHEHDPELYQRLAEIRREHDMKPVVDRGET